MCKLKKMRLANAAIKKSNAAREAKEEREDGTTPSWPELGSQNADQRSSQNGERDSSACNIIDISARISVEWDKH